MTEPFHLMDDSYFLIKNWQKINPRIFAGFTTKMGGISSGPYFNNNMGLHVGDDNAKVVYNRNQFAKKINFPISNWVCCEQTHGSNVQYIAETDWGKGTESYGDSLKDCDGIYTDKGDTLLALCFADCVPIYFFAPKYGLFGIVHAGWKGTVKNISHSLIEQWRSRGIPVEKIFVTIGPSICNQCYIVDNKIIDQVEKLPLNAVQRFYTQVEKSQYQIDLKALNQALLENEGILPDNIQVSGLCSSCEQTYFYSHRRDKGQTGRMIGFIGIREA